MKKRILLSTVSVVLLSALIYFSGPGQMLDSLREARLNYLVFVVAVVIVYLYIRIYRWRYLLRKVGIDLAWTKCIKYFMSVMSIANISPLKSGELFRGYYLKKLEAESFVQTISTVFIERFFDIVVMVSITVWGLLWLFLLGETVVWMWLGVLFYVVILAVFIYMFYSGKRLVWALNSLIRLFYFLPYMDGSESKADELIEKLRKSIGMFKCKRSIVFTFFLTTIIWMVHAFTGFLAFLALGHQISYSVALLVVVISPLLSALTFLPLGLGSNEIVAVTIYSIFLEISLPVITTAVILARVIDSFLPTSVGLLTTATLPKELLDFNKDERS